MNKNIEWVVWGQTADGVEYRGIQKAWYGHSAMDFFAKSNGVVFVKANAEKKSLFDHFLAQGLRNPLA